MIGGTSTHGGLLDNGLLALIEDEVVVARVLLVVVVEEPRITRGALCVSIHCGWERSC